jgi:hypothetical protein
MATGQDALGLSSANRAEQTGAIGGIRFDWVVVAANAWLVGGLVIDGWAHNHGKVDNTFFTPWHALFYSGYLATAVALIGTMILNHMRGSSWGRALPGGYELSLLGVAIFAVGGVGDLIWHSLFGFEIDTEALLSPSHLLLATGIALMITGPLRAAWRRPHSQFGGGLVTYLPMLLSATLFLSLVTFMTQFIHPFVNPWIATGARPSSGANIRLAAGAAAVLVQSGVLMGLLMLLLRRWTLPPGSFTLMFTLNAALLATQRDEYLLILVAAAGGLFADVLAWRLKPSPTRTGALRLFAFAVPVVLYALYFFMLSRLSGIWWTTHMWAGTVVLAGIVGLLLSYLVAPGQIEPSVDA